MSRVRPPDNIEIAALRKKQKTLFDPMTSGAGTPWEDRGTHGTVGAFFKTCTQSMFSPGKLMSSIRRPETINDARGFLIGISAIWVITALMHFSYFVWRDTKAADYDSINTSNTVVLTLLTIAASGGGCFFGFKFYNIIYGKLVATEKDAVLFPDVLLYNVNAYALGPSLLALIPVAGPIIALLWIFINLIVAGNSRLRIRMSAAVIDALLCFGGILLIGGLGYFVVEFAILNHAMDYHAVDRIIPVDHGNTPK
jgi:hypothetical protein